MPGISFLFKKRFHPARIDNQKRLFIAEETAVNRAEREKESADEYRRERELLEYENIAKTIPTAPDGNKSWAGIVTLYNLILENELIIFLINST